MHPNLQNQGLQNLVQASTPAESGTEKAPLSEAINPSRRIFLKSAAMVAGSLIIAFQIPQAKRFLVSNAAAADAVKLPQPNAFIRVAPDNTVTILLAHSEMGQSIWTTLPMLIAEELDLELDKVVVEHAPAAPVYAHTAYGLQITGGSSTTWSEFDRYRQAGALTRALFINAAVEKLGVKAADCTTDKAHVVVGKQRIPYGDLVEVAANIPTPTTVTLKDPKDWKIIGKPTKRLDSPAKTNGTAIFGQDIHFEGLMTAVVMRAPVFGGTVKSFDPSATLKVRGVKKVVQVPSGVAVIAEHFWAAKQGREVLKVEWELGSGQALDTPALTERFRALTKQTGNAAAKAGDVSTALSAASKTIMAEYSAPYLAHSPMEPLNCAVKITDQGCEIWTGTQMQGNDQPAAAKLLGLPPEKVTIHTPFLGGGFGRRANPAADFVLEAVSVAKAAGMPVKTVWTREDDVKGGFYRPMFMHALQVGLDARGYPSAWKHTLVGQSIAAGTLFEGFMVKNGVDALSVEGVADSAYLKSIPNTDVQLHTVKLEVPVLWWRSVGHSHTAFVMESMMDELAHAAGKDPLAYRQALLKDHPRHLASLNLAAKQAGWGTPLAKGKFRGLAVHESFGSYVAQVIEISMEEGDVKVHRVVCAVDCGLVVNPESLRAQMESAVAFGLGAALQSEITFKQGKVVQSNFHDYQVLRMNQMPVVEVHIVQSTEKMGGAGEPGVPPVAPALANAIFAATGKRIRSLPIGSQLSA